MCETPKPCTIAILVISVLGSIATVALSFAFLNQVGEYDTAIEQDLVEKLKIMLYLGIALNAVVVITSFIMIPALTENENNRGFLLPYVISEIICALFTLGLTIYYMAKYDTDTKVIVNNFIKIGVTLLFVVLVMRHYFYLGIPRARPYLQPDSTLPYSQFQNQQPIGMQPCQNAPVYYK